MTTLSTKRPERGACRMGFGAGLGFIGLIGLGNGSLLGLALLLIAAALCIWGYRRVFVGPTLPRLAEVLRQITGRLADLLERTARELRS